ncbi:MAG: hypothetical protein ABJL67_07475 [Sulfitobacter sp.]
MVEPFGYDPIAVGFASIKAKDIPPSLAMVKITAPLMMHTGVRVEGLVDQLRQDQYHGR